ncbi:MAG: N-6 DNA methylase [Planctomycetes bacterium]|nr:N-6 DNA methylase [Planctomycetota bacterium]
MVSEELRQRGLLKEGVIIGEYELFPTYSTTINQYKQAKIVPNKNYGKYGKRKPDGLLIDRRNKINPKVLIVLEYKKPAEFQTDKQKKEAIEQCNDLCQVLEAKIGVITDDIVTYWINPNNPDKKNEYEDRTSGITRSYSYILNDDKQRLQKRYFIDIDKKGISKVEDDIRETYQVIERILLETSDTNSILKPTEKTDPTPLARSVWQSIYISTKDNPTACLYNVVEIFIFKFLSDLGVLTKDRSFNHLLGMYKEGYSNKDVLEHYATKSRRKIKELFKDGDDGTGIINGTIFVNKNGAAVLSQATLFKDTIEKYAKFENLRNIKKEFKTKLFETFLKQSKDKSKLGQFFTPRKVVKAIVEMADINKVKFICDPFCGVGGFVLEPFQVSSVLKNKYLPKNGKINPSMRLLGYDSGREDSDEQRRTIILAKANMLIYLSDLVEKNPTLHDEFTKLFNNTFLFLSDSNLGTLKEKFENEADKPDLILTNPPYITSGVATIRKQIVEEGLSDDYKNSGKGVEGLCLKWIISNLKRGGSAFVILPDSIFNVFANDVLRNEIIEKCYINCIISLPLKTFFNTPKKTYILGITKKDCDYDKSGTTKQTFPVFTYIASNIGETLDINRFEIEDNDLDKAKNLFNQYKGSPNAFNTDDARCKLQPIQKFEKEKYWIIDRWWSKEEKEALGISEKEDILTVDEFKDQIECLKGKLGELGKVVNSQKKQKSYKTKSVPVTDLFVPKKGNAKYTKKYIHDHQGEYSVYSSQTSNVGEIGKIDTYDYEDECFTWTTDGVLAGTVFYRNGKFSITTHCGILNLKEEYRKKVDFDYLLFVLNLTLTSEKSTLGEWANKRLGIERMGEISIDLPITEDGGFDLEAQKEIANKFKKIEQIKNCLECDYKKMINSKVRIIETES